MGHRAMEIRLIISLLRRLARRFIVVLGVVILFAGCNANLDGYSGNYTGSVIVGETQEQILARVAVPDSTHLMIDINSLENPGVRHWRLEVRTGQISTEIAVVAAGNISFNGKLAKTIGNCFESESPQTLPPQNLSWAKVCLNSEAQSQIEFRNAQEHLVFKLTRPAPSQTPFMENPAVYTATQLRDRAQLWSFQSRAEFGRLILAKLDSKLRYLNLLPHISVGSGVAVATFSSAFGLISSVGDIAPFLLPTRWLQARESDSLVRAQELAVQMIQLDSMQIVEGLSVSIGKNVAMHAQLKKHRQYQLELLQELEALEKQAKLPPNTSLILESEVNSTSQTISSLESLLALELTDLAQACGFNNPSAITSISVEPLADIRRPKTLNLVDLQQATLNEPPELLQLEALIRAAETARNHRKFEWIDPSGDHQGALGFGWPTYIAIGTMAIKHLQSARDQVYITLRRKITDAYHDYQGWLDSYQLALEGIELDQKRINIARVNLYTANAREAVDELKDALGGLSVNQLNLLSAEYGWYNSLSRINRLLRQGAYQLDHVIEWKMMENADIDTDVDGVNIGTDGNALKL